MIKRIRWNKLARKMRQAPLRALLALRHRFTPAHRTLVLDLSSHYRFGPFLMASLGGRNHSIEVVKGGAYVPSPAMLVRMGLGMVSIDRDAAAHEEKTLIHDAQEGPPAIAGPWRRIVQLDYDYYRQHATPGDLGADLFGPYFMHPKVYETGLYRSVRRLRRPERTIRTFFAGTIDGDAYTRTFAWPYPSRTEVIDAVRTSFPTDVVYVQRSADKETFLRSRHAIVFAVTSETEDTVEKHVLTQEELLRFAGSSDFFINPPGLRNPHSHNVVEAMAVGAIPILSYGDLFEPALVDGETCIAYDGIAEFVDKLRKVLSMPDHEIRQMRESVCRYYDQYLAPEAFYRTWRRTDGKDVRLKIHNADVVARPGYVEGLTV